MIRRIVRPLAVGLCCVWLSTSTSACFGSFSLTRKLWNFNKTVSDNKFVEWVIFLAFVIIPVYELFSLGDAIIFNSIEFWTGNDVLADVPLSPNETLHLAKDEASGGFSSTYVRKGEPEIVRIFQPTKDGLVVKDRAGFEIAVVKKQADGSIEVVDDLGGRTILHSAEEAGRAIAAFERGGTRALLGQN